MSNSEARRRSARRPIIPHKQALSSGAAYSCEEVLTQQHFIDVELSGFGRFG